MYDLDAIMTRLTVMQREALAATLSPLALDAVAYFPYEQDTFPYMTNRVVQMTVARDDEEDIVIDVWTVSMRLIVGHLTDGYHGEPATRLYTYIPLLLAYFDAHQLLSTAALSEIGYVSPIGAVITGLSSGAYQNSGLGSTQVGADFTLEVPLYREVY